MPNLSAQASAWFPLISSLLGGGLIVAITALAKVVFDHQRLKRQQSDNVAMTLVDKQNERIDTLETEMARERDVCAMKIDQLERRAEEDRKTNEALDMLRRHQVANSKQVLHMTIDLIEVAPDRLEQIIPRIRKRLEDHDEVEARDKAAFMAARFGTPIAVNDPPVETPPSLNSVESAA